MAGRYAQALFDLAKESKATEAVAADLTTFQGMITESDDLRRFLRSPAFSSEEQVKALVALLNKAAYAGIAANFLKLVANKRRLFAVEDMIRDYHTLNDAEQGRCPCRSDRGRAAEGRRRPRAQDALAAVAGSTGVSVQIKIDPSIIGGMVVKLGSRMIDSSLKTKLNLIRTRMKEVG